MKSHHRAAPLLLLISTITPSYAAPSIPDSADKEGWNSLIDQFAECSAVYNIAATLPDIPEQGPAAYRELANHALVAGSYSAQRIGLNDSYLESIYSVKFSHWQVLANDSAYPAKLLEKTRQCLAEWHPLQNELVGDLRK